MRVAWTIVEIVALSVLVGGGVSLFFYALPRGDKAQLIIAAAGTIIFLTIGVAAHFLAALPAQTSPAKDSSGELLEKLIERTDAASRPHVGAMNPVLSPLVVGQAPVVRVMIKNTGKTPAVDVMVGSRVQVGDFPLFPDTRYEAIDGPRVTLGAGEVAFQDTPADHPLTADEMAGLQSGMKWLKVHGEIVFTSDPPPTVPFKHPHFCFVLMRVGELMQVCDNVGDHSDQGVFR